MRNFDMLGGPVLFLLYELKMTTLRLLVLQDFTVTQRLIKKHHKWHTSQFVAISGSVCQICLVANSRNNQIPDIIVPLPLNANVSTNTGAAKLRQLRASMLWPMQEGKCMPRIKPSEESLFS